ncbi:hypothetical protein QYE76_047106 [Lolium multiflorum]|uniref:Uncharacterized protein n=1 Tax=Lolium multiflorum TaxID=4521 RepID=A0AAD8TR84_LOLMU|nr:hypothetical protein QYE76_047106 [Lolium multiflorum]
MASSRTAFPRASGHVQEVQGAVLRLLAQRLSAEVMRGRRAADALGVPVALAVRALAHGQGSEGKVEDMVVHGGLDQREEWHGDVQVAGMVMVLAMVAKWGWCRGLALMPRGAGVQG